MTDKVNITAPYFKLAEHIRNSQLKSKNLNDMSEEIENEIEELKTPDYYLGKLVGEIIYYRFLPTLDVDILKSPTTITVSEDAKLEADRLERLISDTYYDDSPRDKWGSRQSTLIAHTNWVTYINELAETYLPKKLHCRFERIDVVNMGAFKDGLKDYLWDTDLSWYMPEDDFWVEPGKHAWFSEVVLTLKVDN